MELLNPALFSAPNLVLCGFMGCGKSTVGKRLAKITGLPFVDMDAYIETRQGKKIRTIFEEEGEDAFRAMETQAAEELSQQTGQIIASGGGTVLRAENRNILRKSGTILLLDVPFSALRERLKRDTTRPLLQRPDREEAMKVLYEQRMPLYLEAADIVVPAGAPCSVVARRVLQACGLSSLSEADQRSSLKEGP